MKKLLIALFLISSSYAGFAQDFPAKPSTLVNDYTNTLSTAQKQQLEQKLITFGDSSSTQIAIAIVKTVGDYDINEYALGLGRKWGVGQAGKNNGIMIVVALGDRKISIQTGYGVEGVLPDIYAKRIIENDIKPAFKAGNYYQGLEDGTTSIIKYTRGEYKNEAPKSKNNKGGGIGSIVILIVIIAVIVALIKRGGGGGGGQVIGGRGVSNALFLGMLLGSGRSSGGGWGGGGSSAGGFGGFGGGSFGGGGSSGSW
ncbi:MAG: TPM domain-containing protein [Pedobacter sp.]|nr:TPM domain-containing protein [Pedobacter sp.]